MIAPNILAHLGQMYLQESILTVLYLAFTEEHALGYQEISKRTGIFNAGTYGAVSSMLLLLERAERVERGRQWNGSSGWQLTSAEYDYRAKCAIQPLHDLTL